MEINKFLLSNLHKQMYHKSWRNLSCRAPKEVFSLYLVKNISFYFAFPSVIFDFMFGEIREAANIFGLHLRGSGVRVHLVWELNVCDWHSLLSIVMLAPQCRNGFWESFCPLWRKHPRLRHEVWVKSCGSLPQCPVQEECPLRRKNGTWRGGTGNWSIENLPSGV